MPDYYAYTIGSDGHIKGLTVVTGVDDEEAKRIAGRLLDGKIVDLWEMGRFVGRLEPNARKRTLCVSQRTDR